MRRRLRPRLALGLGLAALAPAALCLDGRAVWIVAALDVALLCGACIDLWMLRREPALELTMEVPARVGRHAPFDAHVSLRNRAHRRLQVELTTHALAPTGAVPLRLQVEVPAGGAARRSISHVLAERGRHGLTAPVADYATPLGLGLVSIWPGPACALSVLPNLCGLARVEALWRQRFLRQAGTAASGRRGDGGDLAGLRAYEVGDPPGRVDWRTSARLGAPMVREMHAEVRQEVVVLLDCGRRMATEIDGGSRLDHAVEAALLVANLALRAGDRLGLMAFARAPLRLLRPVRGRASFHKVAETVSDLQPVLEEPGYSAMAARAAGTFRTRSLMLLFTDASEPAALAHLVAPLRQLSRRHTLLLVVFADPFLDTTMQRAGDDDAALYRAGAAADLATERREALGALRDAGVRILECPAHRLSAEAVNHFMRLRGGAACAQSA